MVNFSTSGPRRAVPLARWRPCESLTKTLRQEVAHVEDLASCRLSDRGGGGRGLDGAPELSQGSWHHPDGKHHVRKASLLIEFDLLPQLRHRGAPLLDRTPVPGVRPSVGRPSNRQVSG
jgi:hypothetical protein